MVQGFGAPSSLKTSGSRSGPEPTLLKLRGGVFQPSVADQFSDLTDPRGTGVEHPLLSIVMIAILGVIGGSATGWEE